MVYSIIAESIQQFCQAVIFFSHHLRSDYIINGLNQIGNGNLFFMLPIFKNDLSIFEKMFTLNINIMFAAESFSIVMNIFMFFETIFMMKNPVGSPSLRNKVYCSSAFIVSLAILSTKLIWGQYHQNYSYKTIIENEKIMVYSNFCLFLLMVLLGILNMVYTLKRLGCKSFFKQTYYNKYLLAQIVMMFTYYTCLTPLKFISFNFAIGNGDWIPVFLINVALLAHSVLGVIQFLTRVLETNFYSMIWKCLKKTFCCCRKTELSRESIDDHKEDIFDFFLNDEEPLSKLLNTMMNLEFMSCILYGLKDIYYKKSIKNSYNQSPNPEINAEQFDLYEAKIEHKICYQKLFTDEDIGISKAKLDRIEKDKKKLLIGDLNNDQMLEDINENKSSKITSLLEVDNDTKSRKYDAIITEHFPRLFQDLRSDDNLDYVDMLNSLDPFENKINMLKIKESAGKSGSFFFFSYDKKFIIKTVKTHELEVMMSSFMKSYYKLIKKNPDSLLTRIYGLYTIEIK